MALQVTLYTAPKSSYCDEMRLLLRQQQVEFIEKSVEQPEVAAELRQLAGDEVVPVTVLQPDNQARQLIIGHDRQRLLSLLEVL
jgi:hypothetical protein